MLWRLLPRNIQNVFNNIQEDKYPIIKELSKVNINIQKVNMLLDSGIDINSKYDGMTLLGLLATRNNYKKTISAIKSLLDRGADIYLEDTVLIICNSECPMEIFELFMSYNPDIYKYMINGNRNLLTACADVGNLEKLQMLNADYKFIDKYGNSLIHYAVYNNNSTDSLKK